VVTVILADFRGLDTMVEITVLAVAVIGVASLLRRGRAW
jgi:multicomponent Na+:H+ antiporter subunit A